MKIKLLIVWVCLTAGLMMNACSGTDKKVLETKDSVSTADIMPEPEKTAANPSGAESETAAAESETEAAAAESEDKVFEGRYFDEGVYRYIDMPEAESPFIYCEIIVSNVTGTSFDFAINETVMATGESKNIMPVKTAVFIGDGTKATYQDDDGTLFFTFPDEAGIYPRHMEVSGLEKLEGNVYINNSIPGHESG